jgi:hypothetical protein
MFWAETPLVGQVKHKAHSAPMHTDDARVVSFWWLAGRSPRQVTAISVVVVGVACRCNHHCIRRHRQQAPFEKSASEKAYELTPYLAKGLGKSRLP